MTIDLLADRPGVLILTDTWAPGWVAEVDGVRAPILRVDEAFRGVLVGSGPHHVAFTYAPGFTYLGFALAAAALVVAFGLSALIRVRDRRLVPTAPS
ncbi:MAG: hypothetical protein ACRDF7_07635 [Candidatus Limnocylindrales bacterium]